MRAPRPRALVAGAALALAITGCADIDEPTAASRAETLVEEARATGIAPDLTVDVAESLYGDSAPTVCGPLDDDPVSVLTWSRVNRHMPEEQVTDLVDYDRLVIDTYCPDLAGDYEELLDDLHYDP